MRRLAETGRRRVAAGVDAEDSIACFDAPHDRPHLPRSVRPIPRVYVVGTSGYRRRRGSAHQETIRASRGSLPSRLSAGRACPASPTTYGRGASSSGLVRPRIPDTRRRLGSVRYPPHHSKRVRRQQRLGESGPGPSRDTPAGVQLLVAQLQMIRDILDEVRGWSAPRRFENNPFRLMCVVGEPAQPDEIPGAWPDGLPKGSATSGSLVAPHGSSWTSTMGNGDLSCSRRARASRRRRPRSRQEVTTTGQPTLS